VQPKLSTDKYDPMGERFIWKNKDMDFYKAQSIADDLNSLKHVYDFRATPFELHTLQIANPELRLADIIASPSKKIKDYDTIDSQSFIDVYIKKKLDLS